MDTNRFYERVKVRLVFHFVRVDIHQVFFIRRNHNMAELFETQVKNIGIILVLIYDAHFFSVF